MEISDICKTPISEENPCGEDVTYDTKFEELQKEIDKLSVVSQAGEEINWEKVVSLASEITKNLSRHILVCVYLSYGLTKTEGFQGAVKGTEILKDLISNFWDDMYPPKKRKKGRINAVNWWYTKLDSYIMGLTPAEIIKSAESIKYEDVVKLKNNIKEMDALLDEKLGDLAPLLRPLVQKVERLESEIPKAPEPEKIPEINEEQKNKNAEDAKSINQEKTAPAEPSEAKKVSPAQVATPQPDSISEISDIKDASKLINQGFDTLVKASNFIFEKDISNPICYKIFRLYIWAETNMLPMVESQNKTLIPPPDEKIKSSLELMFKSNDFENLIITCEKTLRNSIFWLDLCRFVYDAMDELGRKFEKAKLVIESETREFIKKLTGIETLAFSDGTPFADNKTKAWIRKISGDKKGMPSLSGKGGKAEESIESDIESEVDKLIQNKEMEKAFLILEKKILNSGSLREELMARIHLVNIFIETGRPELGSAHVDEIISIIDSCKTDRFDPDLAVAGFSAAHSIFSATDADEDKKKDILNKINILSPSTAYRLTTNP